MIKRAVGALAFGLLTSSCAMKVVNKVPDNNCICTMEYDPVCVIDDGVRYRYSNPCNARCDGWEEEDYVRCPN